MWRKCVCVCVYELTEQLDSSVEERDGSGWSCNFIKQVRSVDSAGANELHRPNIHRKNVFACTMLLIDFITH